MFLWKRYQRSARTRRKGKAASDFDLVRHGYGDADDQSALPSDKKGGSAAGGGSSLDWMKAVRKSSLKENNATAAGDADRPTSGSKKSASADHMKEASNSSSSRFKLPKFTDAHRFSASTAALAIPIPKNATAPAAGPSNAFSNSNSNGNSNSSIKNTSKTSTNTPSSSLPAAATTTAAASSASASQVRSYHGPPPRFTGGSSTWREPSTRGVLCRAVFSHKPDEFDEMLMKRGDYVVTDMFFEDGWTLCHIIDPLKYKIPPKSTASAASAAAAAASSAASAASSAFARWRPKSSSKNSSTVNLATSAPASSFTPPPPPAPATPAPTASKKGKEVDPSVRSALAALLSHSTSSSSSSATAASAAAASSSSSSSSDPALSEEITQLYASLNQPRDQTKSGVVPWHCLVEIDPDDIRLMQQRHAEAQLLTMTHQQMANKFAFAYR
ncbi:hypothetical protein HDU86_001601 [Geranomyces michiganensis]|nr:hypothetical protein HDU86_001601 [Geranomyces michiganensis]